MAEEILKNPEAGFDILEKIVRGCQIPVPAVLLTPRPSSRDELVESVFGYYRFLMLAFPERVVWQSRQFSYLESNNGNGGYCLLAYDCRSGKLELSSLILNAQQAEAVSSLAKKVSDTNPADIVLPLPVSLQAPFLGVKRIAYIQPARSIPGQS